MPEDEEQVAVAVAVAGTGAPPCGACRTLRRRCVPGCVFAPYFTAEDFAAAHSVFGASNVSKMLERVEDDDPEQRRVAAATIVEEARARARDPTFGCVSYLRILQEVNDKARAQVDEAREEIAREFGALAASQPVDVAAAAPEVRVEARAQVDAALKHAREQDARLLGVRRANEVRWRAMHEEDHGTGTGTGTGKHKHAGYGKDPDVVIKRHRGQSLSEQTMLMSRAAKQRRSSTRPPLEFPHERSHQQQMAVADTDREKALLMRQQAAQHGHHLAAQHGETEPPPRLPVVCGSGNGQLHQQMLQASREVAVRSVQAPAAAPPQHLDSAGQHAGTGQPRHAGDDAAVRTPGQGSTSVLLEAMMQLAGAGDKQQHLVPRHTQKEVDISQEMLQLQELLDMAELARKQQMRKNDGVMTEMRQWDAAAGVAMMEQDVMTTMQQISANTWQHQDQETMPQQMEEASTSELAKTTGNMSQAQQFAWAQQYHDPAAAVHHTSPWHQPAAASASQVASEQDLMLLLQQHQVAAGAVSLSATAGGACQFDNQLAAQYDDTELTLGYGHHPDMHQQVHAAGQVAGVQDMNSQELMQLAAGAQQQHGQNGLDIAHGNGHLDAETQAMLQELAAILELADERAMMRKRLEQDVRRLLTQKDPDALWLQEMLWQASTSTPDLDDKKLQAEARHAQKELGISITHGNGAHPDDHVSTQGNLQSPELLAMAERDRKLEMLMSQYAAAERARERELITQQAAAAQQQQHHPVGQYSEKEKLEMLMRQYAAAERAREQEMITQQAAAASAKQRTVAARYSELDIAPGQGHGHGHQYWHQPTVQEKQLPTVEQMLQEQQLADAVGFGRHQPNTNLAQQVSGAGATMAFVSPGSAKDAPFLADQQPQSNGNHQMDSSLSPSMRQLHAQVSHQQRTDGGRQGLNSDLAAYLSRHGLAGNGRPQQ